MADNGQAKDTTRKDPLPIFSFKVELGIGGGEAAQGFFKSVGGLRIETEVVPVRAGGVNDTTYQLVGAVKWSNLVFKQGFCVGSELLKWRNQWLTGTGKRITTGKIMQLGTDVTKGPVMTWTFKNGWPCKWEISELDASKSELIIETLEIAHEGLTVE